MITPIPQQTASAALRRIGALSEDQLSPAIVSEGALWLAKWAQPDLKLAPYHRHLNTLVDETRAYIADDRHDHAFVLEAVRQVLARHYGYIGWADPQEGEGEGNLARTIDHRRGQATPLAILYAHVLNALGCTVEFLDFSPRLLIGIQHANGRTLLDPFDGGRLLTAQALRRLLKNHHGELGELTPGQLNPLAPRKVLLRLQHDLKVHHLRHAAPEAAVHALEGALFLAPNTPSLWRELGVLLARHDHFPDAIQALERFLQLPGSDAHRYTASQLLQRLRRKLDSK